VASSADFFEDSFDGAPSSMQTWWGAFAGLSNTRGAGFNNFYILNFKAIAVAAKFGYFLIAFHCDNLPLGTVTQFLLIVPVPAPMSPKPSLVLAAGEQSTAAEFPCSGEFPASARTTRRGCQSNVGPEFRRHRHRLTISASSCLSGSRNFKTHPISCQPASAWSAIVENSLL